MRDRGGYEKMGSWESKGKSQSSILFSEVVVELMSEMLYFVMTSSLMNRSSFTESDLKLLSTP